MLPGTQITDYVLPPYVLLISPFVSTVIKVENLSKYYRLGLIGGRTLHDDLNRWWARVRKQPDPLLKIGQEDRQNPAVRDEYIWALRNLSFEVQQGEIIGIIGRNGAGKSTLLKILSRITAPTSGQVKVKGRIASLLEVGTGFHPELTGRENIYLNGAILGMRKAEIDRKFDEIVDFAEVEKFIDTPVKRYSSGMHVRLAFAVAAHLEPEILVVDEVLAVGDFVFQEKCLGKMNTVAKQGRTVLFVSHNIPSVVQLCNDCLWLDQGLVSQRGKPSEVCLAYLASHQSTRSNGEITSNMHAHAPQGLCFTKALLRNDTGHTTDFFYGDPIQVYCEFEISQPTQQLRIGLALHKFDGTLICALHNTDSKGFDLLDLAPGKYALEARIDLPLMCGEYSMDLFAKPYAGYWGKGQSFDWVRRAINFRIKEVLRDGQTLLATGAIVLPKSEWRVEPIERDRKNYEKRLGAPSHEVLNDF